MTEVEWMACTDIYKMLEHLRGKVSDRKLRLFAVACCHRPFYQVEDERYQRAIQLAERMADEDVGQDEWQEVHQPAFELWQSASAASLAAQQETPRGTPQVEKLVDADMATAAGWAVLEDAWDAAYQVTGVEWDKKHADEPDYQLALLRDIFGNPFGPVTIAPGWLAWNDRTVPKIAQAIYDERAFERLPILTDALEDAGCDNADILNHCRAPGVHVRGCWVVDLLLGKA
jgi:hypothetical protein